MLQLSAYDEAGLTRIESEIHDWYFDLADVTHDRAAGRVVVPFRRWSYELARPLERGGRLRSVLGRLAGTRWEAPWHRWFLRIDEVRELAIEDEARIGTADFNTIAYDAERGTLTIECSIPVTLRLEVAGLAVHLEETAEVLGLARYRTAGDPKYAVSYSGEVLPR